MTTRLLRVQQPALQHAANFVTFNLMTVNISLQNAICDNLQSAAVFMELEALPQDKKTLHAVFLCACQQQ